MVRVVWCLIGNVTAEQLRLSIDDSASIPEFIAQDNLSAGAAAGFRHPAVIPTVCRNATAVGAAAVRNAAPGTGAQEQRAFLLSLTISVPVACLWLSVIE